MLFIFHAYIRPRMHIFLLFILIYSMLTWNITLNFTFFPFDYDEYTHNVAHMMQFYVTAVDWKQLETEHFVSSLPRNLHKPFPYAIKKPTFNDLNVQYWCVNNT